MKEWNGWGKNGRDEERSERDEWRSGMDGGRVEGMKRGVKEMNGGVEWMGEEWKG